MREHLIWIDQSMCWIRTPDHMSYIYQNILETASGYVFVSGYQYIKDLDLHSLSVNP